MQSLFVQNPLITLFTIIFIGSWLGNLKVKGFKFGVSAVLFVGMIFGSIVKGLQLPEFIYTFGLVLFVYCTALETGPSFFASFTKQKLYVNLVMMSLLAASAGSVVMLSRLMQLSLFHASGMFAGAHTNTPALAAVLEQAHRVGASADLALAPIVGYGIAYPGGVLIVIAIFSVMNRFFINETSFASEKENLLVKDFVITNPGMCKIPYRDILAQYGQDFTISRGLFHNKRKLVTPDTTFSVGDAVVIVGTAAGLEYATRLFGGKPSHFKLDADSRDIATERIYLSKNTWIGTPYADLHIPENHHIVITRVMRAGVEFVVKPNTIFEKGDQLTVVGEQAAIEKAREICGGEVRGLAEINLVTFCLGLIAGIAVGTLPIPIPLVGSFQLGNAGGPLLVGLLLGYIGKTQKILWRQPQHATFLLKEMGVVLFLAGVGVRTGEKFATTIFTPIGMQIITFAALLTFCIVAIMILICWKIFRIPWTGIMGIISGMQTQPACLAYANQQTQSNAVNIWYASVYPVATAIKILLAQLILQSGTF